MTQNYIKKPSKQQSKINKRSIFNSLNLKIIFQNEDFLFRILTSIFKKEDFYDLFKDYIDYMQENDFEPFLQILHPKQQILYKKSFLLERTSLMVIFYLLITQNYLQEIIFIQKVIVSIYSNLYSYILLLIDFFSDEEIIQKNINLIKIVTERNLSQFNIKLSNDIALNNKNILSYIKIQSNLLNFDILNKIIKITSLIDQFDLNEGFQYLLKLFTQLYKEKGVVNKYKNQDQSYVIDLDVIAEKSSEKSFSLSDSGQIVKNYVLVLDLDETLVHYAEDQKEGRVYFRPYVKQFISDMSKLYEIMIFTASLKSYADIILQHLDPQSRIFTKKFYREDTLFVNNEYSLKDLSKLDRDLSKVIIIDNIPENFKKQSENGIFIKSWFDDADDKALLELIPILKDIVKKETKDVRDYLKEYKNKLIEKIKLGSLHPSMFF